MELKECGDDGASNAPLHWNDLCVVKISVMQSWTKTMPDESSRDRKPSHSEVRTSIGTHLQEYYAAMKDMPLSDHLESLLRQLNEAERSGDESKEKP
jgi:hypothetical protein